jgi:KDO2-lipid IV(A) lauroyltransferase
LSLQRFLPRGSRIAATLPRAWCEAMADACGDVAWRTARPARRRLAANLQQTLGRPPEDAYLRGAFRAYARYFTGFMRLAHLPPRHAVGPYRWRDGERLDASLARGRGVLVLTAHLGNWDLVGVALAERCGPITVFAERLRPPGVYDFYARVRARHGVLVLPAGAPTREPGRVWERNGVMAVVADRPAGARAVRVALGAGTLAVPAGAVAWALRSGAAVHGIFAVRDGDAFAVECSTDLSRPETTEGRGVQEVCGAFADALADVVRRHPDQWCQWHPLDTSEPVP